MHFPKVADSRGPPRLRRSRLIESKHLQLGTNRQLLYACRPQGVCRGADLRRRPVDQPLVFRRVRDEVGHIEVECLHQLCMRNLLILARVLVSSSTRFASAPAPASIAARCCQMIEVGFGPQRKRVARRDNASIMPRLQPIPLTVTDPVDAPPRVKGRRSDPQKFVVDVKASRIDGQGAFAAEAIPARRKIGEIRGEAVSIREARQRARGQQRIMVVEVSDRRAIDASNSSDPLRFTNHSCRPNAVLRIRLGRVELYAMRDVERGEEITVNYGETHHEGRLRCRCGAAGCIGRL
jgi:hypothetical protein